MPGRLIGEVLSTAEERKERIEPIRRSIRVKATPARAFAVFTAEMDSWWPRTHHIGSSPMQRIVIEGYAGGSIYTVQEDGTDCPWARVLAWEPPHRFLFAWHVGADWKYVEDPAHCSEVEVTFSPADDGTTLVELEHRDFHRHAGAYEKMRDQVGAEGGWGSLLTLFAKWAESELAAPTMEPQA
jgi:uncharacterized protein YndB with AHSA1/START domain